MEKLYSELANIYHIMYQSFINYDEEFVYYDVILKQHNASNVLEIGCGSGNMAKRLLAAGYAYCGIDLSEEMLAIAKHQLPQASFICADMRWFSVATKFDAALIPGRSLSYILTLEDLQKTFNSVYNSLHENGYFIFDVINADKFMPSINSYETIVHTMNDNDKIYSRESIFEINAQNPASAWNWHAVYFVQQGGSCKTEIARDFTTLRSFYKNEIEEVLHQCGFEVVQVNDRPSYAFDTLVFTAKKCKVPVYLSQQ